MPEKTGSASVQGGETQRFVGDMDIPGQWWTLFQSKPLNDLIEQAFKANPDLETAQAALRVAWENVYAQRGELLPSVDAGYSASRQKVAGTLSSPLSSNTNLFSLHTAQVSVAYTLDVFGGTRRQVESLAAQADSQRFQVEAAYLTLTSNVVASAIQEAALRGQIATTRRIVEIQTHALELLRRQLALGQVATADVVAQEAALAQTQATLPPLEKQLAQQRDLLARLIGRFPSETPEQEFELASLQLPRDLPVSLPSKLVEQRPDVRSAEGQLHAAGANIGVAIANRLPNITLSANAGSSAASIAELFAPGTGFWTLAAGITQPVFHGGTLLHKQRAAEAAYDQALSQYRGTVLTAFQNVADSLHAIQSDADALKAAVAAEQAAAKSLAIARRQLERGDIGYLSLLNAEQTYQQASINLVQTLANRYADTAALFAALGGGWWKRSDVPAGVGG
jgi:NodT family efflux transporter outer membrane factor (OMF) lipoprotein